MTVYVVYTSDAMSHLDDHILGVFREEPTAVQFIANRYSVNPMSTLNDMCEFICGATTNELDDCYVHYTVAEVA